MSAPDRDAALESLSNRLREVRSAITEYKKAESDLLARIRLVVGEETGPIKAYGKTVLEVSYARRFDPVVAAAILAHEPDVLARCTETVVSAAKAKAVLPPETYARCQVASSNPTIKPKAAS